MKGLRFYNGKTYSDVYDLDVTDSAKTPVTPVNPVEPISPNNSDDPTSTPTILPKTGGNTIMKMTIGITIFLSISMIIYKKYNNYKDIK